MATERKLATQTKIKIDLKRVATKTGILLALGIIIGSFLTWLITR